MKATGSFPASPARAPEVFLTFVYNPNVLSSQGYHSLDYSFVLDYYVHVLFEMLGLKSTYLQLDVFA